jgi:hypothetical protein
MRQRLADADPKNTQAQTDLFGSYYKMGVGAMAAAEYPTAMEWFQKAKTALADFQTKGWFTKPEQMLGTWSFSQWQANVDRKLKLCQNAEKAIAEIEFVFTQKPEQVPELLAIRVKAPLKRKQITDATASAKRFAAWAEKQEKDRDGQHYNAACIYALCAAAVEETARGKLVEQSLALLVKCRDGGYFSDPAKVVYFQQDSDFAGIRSQAKFQAFVKTLAPPAKK